MSVPSDSRGRVVEFDAHGGWGVVESVDGSRLPFHCTQVAGGRREIDPGAAVRFAVRPGHLGRWEAVGIEPDS